MGRARLDPLQPEGDLPAPETLREYREVSPECLNRILDVFAQEAEHQRAVEREALQARIAFARRGQWFGFVIGMTAILGGFTIAYNGAEWAGAFFSNGGLAGLVSVFVLGRRTDPESAEPPNPNPPSE